MPGGKIPVLEIEKLTLKKSGRGMHTRARIFFLNAYKYIFIIIILNVNMWGVMAFSLSFSPFL